MTIWKFPLDVTDSQRVTMPLGSKPLCVQTQNGTPCIWALVDSSEPRKELVTVLTFGTGGPVIGAIGDYLGTYQMRNGSLVFHVFVRTE